MSACQEQSHPPYSTSVSVYERVKQSSEDQSPTNAIIYDFIVFVGLFIQVSCRDNFLRAAQSCQALLGTLNICFCPQNFIPQLIYVLWQLFKNVSVIIYKSGSLLLFKLVFSCENFSLKVLEYLLLLVITKFIFGLIPILAEYTFADLF